MTSLWWSCKTCGNESYDSVTALHHTQDTGHDGHALATTECPPGPGSSKAARAKALAATRAAIDDAKRRHTTVNEGTDQ